jgi:hypothetical protein
MSAFFLVIFIQQFTPDWSPAMISHGKSIQSITLVPPSLRLYEEVNLQKLTFNSCSSC